MLLKRRGAPEPPGVPYQEDTFDTDSTAQYTEYAVVPATWTIANGELTVTNGRDAAFIRNGTSYTDVAIEADVDTAKNGGLVLRFMDVNNYYLMQLRDDSEGASISVILYKYTNGSANWLAQGDISWPAGTSHTFRFQIVGSTITGFADGQQICQANDSSYPGPGGVGMRSPPGGGGVTKFQAFRWDIQG
jgi:hypothetical protein